MHGTTMVFFVGMPFIAGLANYLIPLMIGARDMAFPRLNALGFWLTLFGGILLYSSYLAWAGAAGQGSAPDVGWFAYAPLTEKAFSPGHQHRFLDSQHHHEQHRQHHHRNQHPGDRAVPADQGHDAGAHAAVCVDVLRGRVSDSGGAAAADRRAGHAAARPLSRRALLRYARHPATPCCGSTSSGCSGTRKSTSS